jgi:hypothetical protein
MTATPPYVPPPPSRWGPGRIVALVIGLVLLLPGLALLAGGGVLLWADGPHRTADGYLMSDSGSFSTDGFALTSDRLDLSTGADWLPVSSTLGTARIEVTGTDPGTDVFVGIASAADVEGYLGNVRRTVVDDLGSTFGTTGISQVDGGAPSGPPAHETFWAQQASGTGTQQLDWEPAQGNWVLVVMNADGSAGVNVSGRVGATVPALTGVAWGVLIAGAVITIIGVLLVVLAVRRGSRRTGPPAIPPSGPPPGWVPPVPRAPAEGEPTRQATSSEPGEAAH